MDWTTVARVNVRRGKSSATADSAVLQELITETSAELEAFVGHHMQSTSRTETYVLARGEKTIWLRGYPVSSIANLWVGSTTDFSTVTPLATSSYSRLDPTGEIRLLTSVQWNPTYVKVEYTGGYAATTAAFFAAYPSLSAACEEQVIAAFLRLRNPAQTSKRVDHGAVEYEKAHDLLPNVERRLRQHRRTWI